MPVSVEEVDLLKLNVQKYVDFIDTHLKAGAFSNSLGRVSIDLPERLEEDARKYISGTLTSLYGKQGWKTVTIYLTGIETCRIELTYAPYYQQKEEE
jgi:hypothetical protein